MNGINIRTIEINKQTSAIRFNTITNIIWAAGQSLSYKYHYDDSRFCNLHHFFRNYYFPANYDIVVISITLFAYMIELIICNNFD